MRITLDTLMEWGADECRCQRALGWFETTFPDGVEDTVAGLCARIPDEWPYDRLWLLHEIAHRIPADEGGDEAYQALLAIAPPDRLAKIVIEMPERDTANAMALLIASGDVVSLAEVIEKAPKEESWRAAVAALTSEDVRTCLAQRITDPERRAALENGPAPDRAAGGRGR